jgi:hypothetical protein
VIVVQFDGFQLPQKYAGEREAQEQQRESPSHSEFDQFAHEEPQKSFQLSAISFSAKSSRAWLTADS